MGLRGKLARPMRGQPPSEPDPITITPEMISIYRRMRRLEQRCDCPPIEELLKFDDWEERECENCRTVWRLNGELLAHFGKPAWMFAYEDPRWNSPRSRQDAIGRFCALERAAKRAKHKYKWET